MNGTGGQRIEGAASARSALLGEIAGWRERNAAAAEKSKELDAKIKARARVLRRMTPEETRERKRRNKADQRSREKAAASSSAEVVPSVAPEVTRPRRIMSEQAEQIRRDWVALSAWLKGSDKNQHLYRKRARELAIVRAVLIASTLPGEDRPSYGVLAKRLSRHLGREVTKHGARDMLDRNRKLKGSGMPWGPSEAGSGDGVDAPPGGAVQ